MKEYRAKTLIAILESMKLNALVGVQSQPHAPAEWNVMIEPGATVDIVTLGMSLHFHGFGCFHGPVQVPGPQPGQFQQQQTFLFTDNLPDMLPDADEIEEVGPEDLRREPLFTPSGTQYGWRATSSIPPTPRTFNFDEERRRAEEAQRAARTGGERRWTPES